MQSNLLKSMPLITNESMSICFNLHSKVSAADYSAQTVGVLLFVSTQILPGAFLVTYLSKLMHFVLFSDRLFWADLSWQNYHNTVLADNLSKSKSSEQMLQSRLFWNKFLQADFSQHDLLGRLVKADLTKQRRKAHWKQFPRSKLFNADLFKQMCEQNYQSRLFREHGWTPISRSKTRRANYSTQICSSRCLKISKTVENIYRSIFVEADAQE